ncbi:MAG: hypothetical protein C0401_06440 [Anaerolinea sp.]|nr:hypothetical protein [Anaerolinea sp.]
MIIRKQFVSISIVLTLCLLLSACSAFGPVAAPTLDPLAQQATVNAAVTQAMQTVSADLTSTASALPTSTDTPTQEPVSTATPEPTATLLIPTATNTFVPPPPKPTATATPAAYACKLISTVPAAGTKINISTDFDAVWKVQNVGTKLWEIGYVDLKYVSGTKMQTVADIFDVTTAVTMGGELTLTVDMKTPSTAGKYTAIWVLTMDGVTMCTLPVSIEAVTP